MSIKITSDNFQFLRESSGPNGNIRTSLTVDELDKFCATMQPVVDCMSWKSKTQQENVRKVVTILKQAANDARMTCEEDSSNLPFNL